MRKAPSGAFCIFAERVWAFEPCSTNRPKPVGDAAPQAQVNPTLVYHEL
jgi:hypothetical protein